MIFGTGCAGFGSNFVHCWLNANDEGIVNIDKLTYAGNLASLEGCQDDARYSFVHGDIGDCELRTGCQGAEQEAAARGRQLRRRVPCRPLTTQPASIPCT